MNRRQGFPAIGSGADTSVRADWKEGMVELVNCLAEIPGLAEALHAVRRLPPPRFSDDAWSVVSALIELLPRLSARLTVAFRRRGRARFHAGDAGGPGGPRWRVAVRSAALARRTHRSPADRRVPGYLVRAARAPAPTHRWLAARRRPDGVRGRRSDAVDLPVPRSRGPHLRRVPGRRHRSRQCPSRISSSRATSGRTRDSCDWVNGVFPERAGRRAAIHGAVRSRSPGRRPRGRRRPGIGADARPPRGRCSRSRRASSTRCAQRARRGRRHDRHSRARAHASRSHPARAARSRYRATRPSISTRWPSARRSSISRRSPMRSSSPPTVWHGSPCCARRGAACMLPDLARRRRGRGGAPVALGRVVLESPSSLAGLSADGRERLRRVFACVRPALEARGRAPVARASARCVARTGRAGAPRPKRSTSTRRIASSRCSRSTMSPAISPTGLRSSRRSTSSAPKRTADPSIRRQGDDAPSRQGSRIRHGDHARAGAHSARPRKRALRVAAHASADSCSRRRARAEATSIRSTFTWELSRPPKIARSSRGCSTSAARERGERLHLTATLEARAGDDGQSAWKTPASATALARLWGALGASASPPRAPESPPQAARARSRLADASRSRLGRSRSGSRRSGCGGIGSGPRFAPVRLGARDRARHRDCRAPLPRAVRARRARRRGMLRVSKHRSRGFWLSSRGKAWTTRSSAMRRRRCSRCSGTCWLTRADAGCSRRSISMRERMGARGHR